MDIGTIQKFGMVGVSPPTQPDDLQQKQEAIEKKLKWYEDNGAQALQDQIDQLIKQQIQAEEQVKEQLAREKAEEEKEEPVYQKRGGRGGRGRGDRGGRGGYRDRDQDERRGTAGRGARVDNLLPKSEFEGEDDDAAYTAPKRPAQEKKSTKQIKTDMELNEDNYPTF